METSVVQAAHYRQIRSDRADKTGSAAFRLLLSRLSPLLTASVSLSLPLSRKPMLALSQKHYFQPDHQAHSLSFFHSYCFNKTPPMGDKLVLQASW